MEAYQMTQTIQAGTRNRALSTAPDVARTLRPSRLLACVRGFTGMSFLAGATFAIIVRTDDDFDVRLAIGAGMWFILAALGGVVLFDHSRLPTDEELYRRGFIEGWVRGAKERSQKG
jgi:hypothetical protein